MSALINTKHWKSMFFNTNNPNTTFKIKGLPQPSFTARVCTNLKLYMYRTASNAKLIAFRHVRTNLYKTFENHVDFTCIVLHSCKN